MGPTIGTRIREVRMWRGKTLKAAAQLAGLSEGHLSKIERGHRSIDRRSTVEAIANALGVAPSDLLAEPLPMVDPVSREAHTALTALDDALSHNRLGESYLDQARPWEAIAADLRRLNRELRPTCDYLGQGTLLPALIDDLHALYVHDPAHRPQALEGLMHAVPAAAYLAKALGASGLPQLAALHARLVAEELGDPAWIAAAEYVRAQVAAGRRERSLAMSVRAASAVQGETSTQARQAYGMLHLNAAMASATLHKMDDADQHLAEAQDTTRATADDPYFAHLWFGDTNVGIWRVAVATEVGEAGKVIELAQRVRPDQVPSAGRRAMFHADVGRALARERGTRAQAVVALRRAEEIAPQLVRTNPYVREAVTDLMRWARRDATHAELRGMAYRMGLAG